MKDCPVCKASESLVSESFEDGYLYVCTFCGRDVSNEVEEQEMEEALSEDDEEYYLDRISGTEGDHESDPVPSVGGTKD